MKIFDSALTLLERALDVRLQRQNVLASNAANIDTPGFKEKDLDFKQAMQSVVAAPQDSVDVAVHGATHELESGAAGLDDNTVDLDRTMVALSENGLQYSAAARAASKKLAILKYVANDGNG
jgi:flagellar basal-body rod protein FlgB